MRRGVQLGVAALFAGLLVLPWLAGLLGVEPESVENRDLAARPAWTAGSWLRLEDYEALAAWLRDGLPLRSQAIRLDSRIDYFVLGDSPSPRVWRGPDGDLFLDKSVACSKEDAADLRRQVAELHRLAGHLEGLGTDVYVVVSPNKTFLFSDRLPRSLAATVACQDGRRRELRRLLSEPGPFTLVADLWSAFEREHAAGHRLFPPLSRHWDERASVLQSRALVETIQPGLWEGAQVAAGPTEAEPAELPLRFMNLEIDEPMLRVRVTRPGVVVDGRHISLPGSTRRVRHFRARSDGPALLPGRTAVLHDSFMGLSWAKIWLPLFVAEAHYMSWDVARVPGAAGYLAQADRVVLQTVEDNFAEKYEAENVSTLLRLMGAPTDAGAP